MYCSLEDAWQDNSLTSSQNNILSTQVNTPKKELQIPTHISQPELSSDTIIESFINKQHAKKPNCSDIISKVLSCPTCKSILIHKLNSKSSAGNKFIDKIFNNSFFSNNKDVITIVITIIIIILIIDFIVQALKNN